MKPMKFLALSLAVFLLSGCAAPTENVAPTEPATTQVAPSVTPSAPLTTAVAKPSPVAEALPETFWPAAAGNASVYEIAELSPPDELLFRNVLGNAAAACCAQLAEFYKTYAQRRASMETMNEEEAGNLDSQMDFQITYLGHVRNLFPLEGGTHACMESEGVIFSEFLLLRGGEEMALGFAAPSGKPFAEMEIAVYIDGYPANAFLDFYPLTQGTDEQYAIYTVHRARGAQSSADESLVEVRLADANFVFRVRWDKAPPRYPETEEQAKNWLLEAEALRNAIPLSFVCVSLGDTSRTENGLTFELTELSAADDTIRVAFDVTAEANYDEVCEPRYNIREIRLIVGNTEYHIGRNLAVRRIMPTDFVLKAGETCSLCWEMELSVYIDELFGKQITLAFGTHAHASDGTGLNMDTPGEYAFLLKIDAAA